MRALPPDNMATPEQLLTATIIYGYAWDIDMVSKQTLSHTKTYTNTPGIHKVYDVIVNSALPSASRFETVGIQFTMTPPGGIVTHPHLASIATSRPTRSFAPVSTGVDGTTSNWHIPACKSTPCWSALGWRTDAYPDLVSVGFIIGILLSVAFLVLRALRGGYLKHSANQGIAKQERSVK
ncbi:hypothetical protein Q7P37_007335 [Cladosporium fusiforme]